MIQCAGKEFGAKTKCLWLYLWAEGDLNLRETAIFVPNFSPAHKMMYHYETHDSMRSLRVWRKNGVFMAVYGVFMPVDKKGGRDGVFGPIQPI